MNFSSKIRILFLLFLGPIALCACDPSEELPAETVIYYNSTSLMADSNQNIHQILVQCRFEDGDGNIGLEKKDTIAPFIGEYFNNLYLAVFDLKNTGLYEPLMAYDANNEAYPVRFGFRVPVLQNTVGTSIKATLDMTIQPVNVQYIKSASQNGTVRFEAYMYDRTLLKSNVVTTPAIRLSKDSIR